MAKKSKTVFVCQECGYESPKWMGQCVCGAWNSFVEEKVVTGEENDPRRRTGIGANQIGGRNKAGRLADVKGSDADERITTGSKELDRVLGGGMVKGSLTLISGEPGIGKSTLLMQTADSISKGGRKVLYVSGEESEIQLKMRADRICGEISDNFMVLSETNMENIAQCAVETEAGFIIVDSIQTVYSSALDSAPGSVSQVRACGNELMRLGKTCGIPVFIVAHVTKSGELAGPKIVEHLVDCVLHFTGERNHELRILRSFKNRFGTTSEIGAFEMTQDGLKGIENLSQTFLEGTEEAREGSTVSAVYEGTRPLLLEIQALTSPTNIGFARRTAIGIDLSRLNMILAVLEKKAGISMINQDVYVNVVGGLRPEGTYTDLSVAMSVYSSYRGKEPEQKTIVFGEIGLTGELRGVQHADKIVKEAVRMGYKKIILPRANAVKLASAAGEDVRIIGVSEIGEAIRVCFP